MNHTKNGGSYVAHKATRRRNEINRYNLAHALVYGNGDIDGGQAIIDLALESGTRLTHGLIDRLGAAGYEIPDAIRPKAAEMDEAGSACDTPASEPEARHHDEPGTDHYTRGRSTDDDRA